MLQPVTVQLLSAGPRIAQVDGLLSADECRLALDAAEMGAFSWHAASGALRWSERLQRIAGLEPGSFGGTLDDFLALVHPDDRERLRQRTLHPPAEGDVGTEYRLVRPDGVPRPGQRELALLPRLDHGHRERIGRLAAFVRGGQLDLVRPLL